MRFILQKDKVLCKFDHENILSGENKANQIKVKVEDENLWGKDFYIEFTTPSGESVSTPKLNDYNGIVFFDDLGTNILDDGGEIKIQVVVRDNEDLVLKSTTQTFLVGSSVDASKEYQSTNGDFISEANKVLEEMRRQEEIFKDDGDGTKFLADDGIYKLIEPGGIVGVDEKPKITWKNGNPIPNNGFVKNIFVNNKIEYVDLYNKLEEIKDQIPWRGIWMDEQSAGTSPIRQNFPNISGSQQLKYYNVFYCNETHKRLILYRIDNLDFDVGGFAVSLYDSYIDSDGNEVSTLIENIILPGMDGLKAFGDSFYTISINSNAASTFNGVNVGDKNDILGFLFSTEKFEIEEDIDKRKIYRVDPKIKSSLSIGGIHILTGSGELETISVESMPLNPRPLVDIENERFVVYVVNEELYAYIDETSLQLLTEELGVEATLGVVNLVETKLVFNILNLLLGYEEDIIKYFIVIESITEFMQLILEHTGGETQDIADILTFSMQYLILYNKKEDSQFYVNDGNKIKTLETNNEDLIRTIPRFKIPTIWGPDKYATKYTKDPQYYSDNMRLILNEFSLNINRQNNIEEDSPLLKSDEDKFSRKYTNLTSLNYLTATENDISYYNNSLIGDKINNIPVIILRTLSYTSKDWDGDGKKEIRTSNGSTNYALLNPKINNVEITKNLYNSIGIGGDCDTFICTYKENNEFTINSYAYNMCFELNVTGTDISTSLVYATRYNIQTDKAVIWSKTIRDTPTTTIFLNDKLYFVSLRLDNSSYPGRLFVIAYTIGANGEVTDASNEIAPLLTITGYRYN